jgi:DNA-binding FrmR family transcriptional regulator
MESLGFKNKVHMDDKVLVRLKRIRGQVDGIIKMYEECRECSDVVTQVAAARAALGAVGKELLTEEVVSCLRAQKSSKLEQLLKQLFEIT